MTAYLKEDVYSYFKAGRKTCQLYGTSGEKVTVISDRGNVMIVENEKGAKYSVLTEKLIIVTKS